MENNFFSPPPLGEEIIIRDKSRIYSKRVLWRNNETSRIRIEKKKNLDDEDFNLQISQLFRFDFPDESNKRKKKIVCAPLNETATYCCTWVIQRMFELSTINNIAKYSVISTLSSSTSSTISYSLGGANLPALLSSSLLLLLLLLVTDL